MANNQAIRPYYYNLGKEYGLDKNAIDSLLSYNDSTGEVSFGGKNLGKPVSETNGVSYWDKSFLDNEWNNYVKNAGLVKKGAKSENRVGAVEGYKPTSDVNNIYKQKQKWADANAANDIKGQNEAATAVQKFYNSMRENGYGDVADELENTPAGSDYAKKYYNMAGNVAFRDYMYQLGANDGLSKEDVDKLIDYNDTTGEVFFGGKNLGKPVGEFDGVSYWNQNDLDNVYKNYMNNGGAQRLTDEQRYNKMAALSDKANEDQYNRLIGQQDKRNDKVYELLDEAYKLPSYENIIKGVMSKYDLAAMQGRDNAAASAAASNGGNIDSYAAANAARQQAALTSEGLAQAHKMGLEAYNARIGNAQSILENLGVQLNNDNTAVRSNIEGINANRQAYFENDETRKNNDVTRKAAMSEVTGYAPKEWVLAGNPYFNDDGTLKKEYKKIGYKAAKAINEGRLFKYTPSGADEEKVFSYLRKKQNDAQRRAEQREYLRSTASSRQPWTPNTIENSLTNTGDIGRNKNNDDNMSVADELFSLAKNKSNTRAGDFKPAEVPNLHDRETAAKLINDAVEKNKPEKGSYEYYTVEEKAKRAELESTQKQLDENYSVYDIENWRNAKDDARKSGNEADFKNDEILSGIDRLMKRKSELMSDYTNISANLDRIEESLSRNKADGSVNTEKVKKYAPRQKERSEIIQKYSDIPYAEMPHTQEPIPSELQEDYASATNAEEKEQARAEIEKYYSDPGDPVINSLNESEKRGRAGAEIAEDIIKAAEYYDKNINNTYGDNPFGRGAANYRLGRNEIEKSSAAYTAYKYGSTNLTAADIYNSLSERLQQNNPGAFSNRNAFDTAVANIAQYIPQGIDQFIEGLKGQAVGAAIGLILGGVGSVDAGRRVGSAAFSAKYMFEQTAGAMYYDLIKDYDMSPEDAKRLSTNNAIVSSVIEFGLDYAVGKILISDDFGAAKAVTKEGGKGIKSALDDGIIAHVIKKVMPESKITGALVKAGVSEAGAKKAVKIAVTAGKYAISSLGEGAEEWLQQGGEIVAKRYAKEGKSISPSNLMAEIFDFSKYTDEDFQEMNTAFIGGVTVGFASHIARSGVANKVTRKVAEKLANYSDSVMVGIDTLQQANGTEIIQTMADNAIKFGDDKTAKKAQRLLDKYNGGTASTAQIGELVKLGIKNTGENAVSAQNLGDAANTNNITDDEAISDTVANAVESDPESVMHDVKENLSAGGAVQSAENTVRAVSVITDNIIGEFSRTGVDVSDTKSAIERENLRVISSLDEDIDEAFIRRYADAFAIGLERNNSVTYRELSKSGGNIGQMLTDYIIRGRVPQGMENSIALNFAAGRLREIVQSAVSYSMAAKSKVFGDENIGRKTAERILSGDFSGVSAGNETSVHLTRVGEHYEAYGADAAALARLTGVSTYYKDSGNGGRLLTAGVPVSWVNENTSGDNAYSAEIYNADGKERIVLSKNEIVDFPEFTNDMLNEDEEMPWEKTAENDDNSADVQNEHIKIGAVPYTDKEKQNWEKSNTIIVYENDKQFEDFIEKVLNNEDTHKKIYFGKIPDSTSRMVLDKTGIDVSEHNIALKGYEIRKILLNSHGDAAQEAARGQERITADDLKNIPSIIAKPDNVTLSDKKYEGKPALLFEKKINGQNYIVAYVSRKHKDIAVQTMYKKRSLATAENADALSFTPETTNSTASDNISLSQDKNNVNSNISENSENDTTADNSPGKLKTENVIFGNDEIEINAMPTGEEFDAAVLVARVGGVPVYLSGNDKLGEIVLSFDGDNVSENAIKDDIRSYFDGIMPKYAQNDNKYYSKDEELRFSISAQNSENDAIEKSLFTTNEDDAKNYIRQVNDWQSGKMKDGEQFELGKTPAVLSALGADDLPVVMSRAVMEKITGGKHDIDIAQIKQLPQAISDPIMIFKSATVPDAFVLLTELTDKAGNDVVVAMHLSRKMNRLNVNRISSVYGKENITNFVKAQTANGNLKYMDKNKSQNWSTSRGLQLPKLVQSNPDNNNILQKSDIVNTYSTQNSENDASFSLSEPEEETKNLIAVHNLSAEKLEGTLELGGFPMPSIAVAKDTIGHENFGDISIVFYKDTIDPKANEENRVYSADAWTPVFPPVEYEANSDKVNEIRNKYLEISRKYGYSATRALYKYSDVSNIEDKMNSVGGERNLIEDAKSDVNLMQVFLYDIGEGKVEPIEKKTVSKISDSEAREYDYFIEKLGKDAFDEMRTNPGESPIKARKEWFNKYGEKFDNTLREYLSERFGFSEEQTDNVVNAETTASKSKKAIKIRNYMMNGKETVSTEYDYSATADAIKKLAAENGFEDWVDNLLTGVEKSKGLYNGKDPYTNMGDRKSFSQLHYDVTLENIVKAMKIQGDGDMKNVAGFHGIKTLRAACAKTFKSIADIHNSEEKIKNLSEEEAKEINDKLGERLSKIINYIYAKKAHSQYENSLIEFDRIGEIITECCELEDKSPGNIMALFKNYRYDIDNKAANGIVQLLFDVSQMPVHIFEAKPGRVVSLDEIAFAAVPKGKYPELKRKLEGKGIKVKEYDPDVDGSRLDVLNSEPDVKFSVSRGIDADRGIRYNGDTYSNTNGKEGKESGNGNYSISENEGRNSNAHSAVKGRPLFRIGRGALGKRGREKYIQNLDREYDIERGVINKTVKAEFIRVHAYNDDMREMESDLKVLGFDKVGFFVGAGRLVHRPLSSCSAVIFKNSDTGRKEVYLRYDDGEYSPRQLAVHEIGHDIYNSRLGRKIKNIIENSIPFAERNAIMQQKRYKLYAEALEDPELVFEEFVCDVLGGMTDYSSTHFENLMNAFWNQDLEFINNYKVAEYPESIDAGGTTNNKISYSAENNINDNGGTVITANDVKAVQSIPRKSVNGFTSNEIQKTEGFARKYFNEMGTKSPFFRRWFGDWRANDTTTVNVANKKGAVRGTTKNIDTGWDIQISGKVFNETRSHNSKSAKSAVDYLNYINSIVENAVLLDSYTVQSAKAKSASSAMMHSLYAIADIGNGKEVIKLYVEELNDVNNDGTITRAYQLQNITKAPLASVRVQGKSLSSLTNTLSANTYTVSQLFNIVKRVDANFNPNDVSKVINADGTPKIMYRGDANMDFTVFDRKKSRSSNLYGRGFYFTESESNAKTYGKPYPFYLKIENPLIFGEHNISKAQLVSFLKAVAENEDDYDIWNYGTTDINKIAASLYGKGDLEMLQDISATAIGDLVEAIELFNSVNNTNYDGIITDTETIVFDSKQIKSATDNIGTFDGSNADIRFSIGDEREYLKSPIEKISNDIESVRLQAELRQGKVFERKDVNAVRDSILNNISIGDIVGIEMTSKAAKAEMSVYINRALNAAGKQAREKHARALARYIAQNASAYDNESLLSDGGIDFEGDRATVLGFISHGIKLSEDAKAAIISTVGERSAKGYIALMSNKDALGVDSVYDELADVLPGYFPSDVLGDGNKMRRILEVYTWLNEGRRRKGSDRLIDVMDEEDAKKFVSLIYAQISEAFESGGRDSALKRERDSVREAERAKYEKYAEELSNKYDDKIVKMRKAAKNKAESAAKKKKISVKQERYNFKSLDEAISKFGRIKEGETPYREVAIPKKISESQPISRFARTLAESEVLPEAAMSEFEERILDGSMSYEKVTDKDALKAAERIIKRDGFKKSLDYWDGLIANNMRIGKKEFALGQLLFNQCVTAKDTQRAMKIAVDLAHVATQAGQVVQASRLIKQMSPDAQLYSLESSVMKLQEEFDAIHKHYNNKYGDLKITINKELEQKYIMAENEEQREAIMDEILQDVADQIPSTFKDKWDSWRYLSMLFNPKTHIRNILGNLFFTLPVRIKNCIGWVMEKSIDKDKRTKAIKSSKANKDFAEKDYAKIRNDLSGGGGKYESINGVDEKRQIFKFKPLEALRKTNFYLLEAEDGIFLKHHYKNSMAQVMTARGYTAEFLSSGTAEANAALDQVRKYAFSEAQKATYRDANKLASWLNTMQKDAQKSKNAATRSVGYLVEGAIPFKKTPLNILKRGIEYSPIGVIQGVYDMVKGIKNENFTASEAIDKLASGISGSALMALGIFLASLGFVKGDDDDDDAAERIDSVTGVQNYSLIIGGKSYTIDWMAPMSLPFFVGVNIHSLFNQDEEVSFESIFAALKKLPDPLLNLSVLSSLNDILNVGQYVEEGKALAVAGQAATSYVQQAFPSVLGQVARTVDSTKRNAYYDDPENGIPSEIERFCEQMMAKTPGLSTMLEPKVDMWGRLESYGDTAFGRFFGNFISPGYYKEIISTELDDELRRLNDEYDGEGSVLPSKVPKNFKYGGVRYDMTDKEHTKFAIIKGQRSFELADELIRTDEYKKKTPEEKKKSLEKCYDAARDEAKAEILKGRGVEVER